MHYTDCCRQKRKIAAAAAAADAAYSGHCSRRCDSQGAVAVATAWMRKMGFDRRAAFAHSGRHLELDLEVAEKRKKTVGAAVENGTWNAAIPSAPGWAVLELLHCYYYLSWKSWLADWARCIQQQWRPARPGENAPRQRDRRKMMPTAESVQCGGVADVVGGLASFEGPRPQAVVAHSPAAAARNSQWQRCETGRNSQRLGEHSLWKSYSARLQLQRQQGRHWPTTSKTMMVVVVRVVVVVGQTTTHGGYFDYSGFDAESKEQVVERQK